MSDKSLGATAFAVYKTLEISLLCIAQSSTGRLSIASADQLLRGWGRDLCAHTGVELEILGRDSLSFDRAYVVMSNHQSHFDIPVIYSAFPGSLRMVGKQELFKVPIWGRAMRESGFVSVSRSGNRDDAKQSMGQAAEALGRGISIWMAPEGTRSMDGQLGAFKKGGFRLALETGTSILPITIDGTRAVLPKKQNLLHRGGHVRVTFGKPIETSGRTLESLMNDTRAFLAQAR